MKTTVVFEIPKAIVAHEQPVGFKTDLIHERVVLRFRNDTRKACAG